ERVNRRYARDGWQPIVLRAHHHEPEEIYEYFRASELCFVSSLHDGMNLVAKEFVAARDDERGALVLSQFTGAARELPEALIVNPYDIDQSAAALHLALTMPPEAPRARMRSMRGLVREFNVYRWAGRGLLAAAPRRLRRRVLKSGAAASRIGARRPGKPSLPGEAVIPAEAGIQPRAPSDSRLDSRLRGNDGVAPPSRESRRRTAFAGSTGLGGPAWIRT